MRAFVFTDKALESEAGRFVWLAINTEKPENAAFRQKYQIQALPTYFIVDPDSERVILIRVGASTAPQLLAALEDGRRIHAARRGARLDPADQALARADALLGAGENALAASAYAEAMAAAPSDWPSYGRAVESRLFALQSTGENEAAAKLAREALPRVAGSPAAAGVAGAGLDGALALPAEHPERAGLLAALEPAARQIVDDATSPASADDRSSIFGSLIEARKEAGDSTGARAMAERWATFLEGEAGKARLPQERTVFDSHRLAAYLELGQPERAIPMLLASERELPEDYNPPARLAVAYAALKKWDEGLAAADRALARAYGPRKLRIFRTKADLLVGKGETAGARATLEEAVRHAESLPPDQRSEATLASLRKKLEALAGSPPPASP